MIGARLRAFLYGMLAMTLLWYIVTERPKPKPKPLPAPVATASTYALDDCRHYPNCPAPPRPCETGAYCVLAPGGEVAIPMAYDWAEDGWFLQTRAGFAVTWPELEPAGGTLLDLPGVGANPKIKRIARAWICPMPYQHSSLGIGLCDALEHKLDFSAVHGGGKYHPDVAADQVAVWRSRTPIVARYDYSWGGTAGYHGSVLFGAVDCRDGSCHARFVADCEFGLGTCMPILQLIDPEVRLHILMPVGLQTPQTLLTGLDGIARLVDHWYRPDPGNPELARYAHSPSAAQPQSGRRP